MKTIYFILDYLSCEVYGTVLSTFKMKQYTLFWITYVWTQAEELIKSFHKKNVFYIAFSKEKQGVMHTIS